MPEIDTELFQQIALGLLGLLLIVLLLVLNTLGKVRKSLAEGIRHVGDGTGDITQVPAATPAASMTDHGYTEPWGAPAAAQPVQAQPVQAQPAMGTQSMGGTRVEALPEEQPFERDGRWWFKRGDELLVYDEATGQWTPAPANNPFSGGGGPSAMTSVMEPVGGGEGGFWKCPSCGAVNGSTSPTCRMCFTPRPG